MPPQVTGSSSAGDVLTGKWGQRCGCLKMRDKQDAWIVNPTHQSPRIMQLFTNRKQCGWSRQVRLPPQTCLSTGRTCSLYQREQFSFQFPSPLAFISVASGTLCSRVLLVGWSSSVPHCKKTKVKGSKSPHLRQLLVQWNLSCHSSI